MPKKIVGKNRNLDPCVLCGSKCDDPSLFGTFFQLDDLRVHQFCALFASGLMQNGPEEDECGFLKEDVLQEVKRARRLRCHYCRKCQATIGCAVKKCTRSYHFQCGVEHGSLNQYYGHFSSFCSDHKPRQPNLRGSVSKHPELFCGICYCSISADQESTYLRTPCCASGWFHRTCCQEYAVSAGYFFKCPFCNNRDLFRQKMQYYGIYVPDQDASWERVENAFQELLEKPQCGASECLCPYGRKRSRKKTSWEIIICGSCGGDGRHIRCGKLSYSASWKCPACVEVEEAISQHKSALGETSRAAENRGNLAKVSRSCARFLESENTRCNSKSDASKCDESEKKLLSSNEDSEEVLKISYDSSEDEFVDVTSVDLPKPIEEPVEVGETQNNWIESSCKLAINDKKESLKPLWSVIHYSHRSGQTSSEVLVESSSESDVSELINPFSHKKRKNINKIISDDEGEDPIDESMKDDTESAFASDESGVVTYPAIISKSENKMNETVVISDDDDGEYFADKEKCVGFHEPICASSTKQEGSDVSDEGCSPSLRPTVIKLKNELAESSASSENSDDSGIGFRGTTTHPADIPIEVPSQSDESKAVSSSSGFHSTKPKKPYQRGRVYHQASIAKYLQDESRSISIKDLVEVKELQKRSAAKGEHSRPSKCRKKSQNDSLLGRLRTLYDMHYVIKK